MPKYYVLVTTIIILSGCFKERIDLDYNQDQQKKVTIVGWINSLPEPQNISIRYTANYLGAEIQEPISGVEVTLSDGNQEFGMSEEKPGLYVLPSGWRAKAGSQYHLEVVHRGKTYTATHKMRISPEIENATHRLSRMASRDSSLKYETVFDFQEIPGEGDAYYAVDYQVGSPAKDSIINGGYADDRFVDGQFFEDVVVTEDDRLFDSGDTAIIEIHSIGLETALFLQDIETEIYRGSPFDPPPANVRTNITGGATGYFIASDARRDTVFIP